MPRKAITDAALTAAQKSLEIAKRLSDIDSGNFLWRHDFCASYGGLGGTQRDKGDKVGALDNYSKALL